MAFGLTMQRLTNFSPCQDVEGLDLKEPVMFQRCLKENGVATLEELALLGPTEVEELAEFMAAAEICIGDRAKMKKVVGPTHIKQFQSAWRDRNTSETWVPPSERVGSRIDESLQVTSRAKMFEGAGISNSLLTSAQVRKARDTEIQRQQEREAEHELERQAEIKRQHEAQAALEIERAEREKETAKVGKEGECCFFFSMRSRADGSSGVYVSGGYPGRISPYSKAV